MATLNFYDCRIDGGKASASKITASPEMIARRVAALEEIRKPNPYREIPDALNWQREIREDCPLPNRQ